MTVLLGFDRSPLVGLVDLLADFEPFFTFEVAGSVEVVDVAANKSDGFELVTFISRIGIRTVQTQNDESPKILFPPSFVKVRSTSSQSPRGAVELP